MESNEMSLKKNRISGMVVQLHRERDRQQALLNRIIQKPCDNNRRSSKVSVDSDKETMLCETKRRVENNIETLDYLRGISCLEKDFVELADNIVSTTLKLSHECIDINREALSPTQLTSEVNTAWQQISELGNTVQAHVTHARRYHLFYLDIDHLEQKIEDIVSHVDNSILELKGLPFNEVALKTTTSTIKQILDSFVQVYLEWQKIATNSKAVAPLHFRRPLQPGQHTGTLMNTVSLPDGERLDSGSRVFVRASRPGDRLHHEWFIENEAKAMTMTVPAPLVWLNSPESTPTPSELNVSPTMERVRRSQTVSPSSYNNRKAVERLRRKLLENWDLASSNMEDVLRDQSIDLLNQSLGESKKKMKDDDNTDVTLLLETIIEFKNSHVSQNNNFKELERAIGKMHERLEDDTIPLPVVENDIAEAVKDSFDAYTSFQISYQQCAVEESAVYLENNLENDILISKNVNELTMSTAPLTHQDEIQQPWKQHHISRHQTGFESITATILSPNTLSTPSSIKRHRSKKLKHRRRGLSQPPPQSELEERKTEFSSYHSELDKYMISTKDHSLQEAVLPYTNNPTDWLQTNVTNVRSVSLEVNPQVARALEESVKEKEKKKKSKRHAFQNPFRRRHTKVIMSLVSTTSSQIDNGGEHTLAAEDDVANQYQPCRYGEEIVEEKTWIQHGTPTGIAPPTDALILPSPRETSSTLGRNYRKHPRRSSILCPLSVNTLDSGVYTEADSGNATINTPEIKPVKTKSQKQFTAAPTSQEMDVPCLGKVTPVDSFTVACQIGELPSKHQSNAMMSASCQHGVCQKSKCVETEQMFEDIVADNTNFTFGKKLQVGKPWCNMDKSTMESPQVETIHSSAQTAPQSSHDYVNLANVNPIMFEIGLQTTMKEPLLIANEQHSVNFAAPPNLTGDEIVEICIDSSDLESGPNDVNVKRPKQRTLIVQSSAPPLVNSTAQTECDYEPKKATITGISCELQFQEPGVMVGDDDNASNREYPATLEPSGNKNLRFYINFKDPSVNHRLNSTT